MGQAVRSVTLAIAFDTVASFQPTGDLDDGDRSEEKKNSRFPKLLEERSTLAEACEDGDAELAVDEESGDDHGNQARRSCRRRLQLRQGYGCMAF